MQAMTFTSEYPEDLEQALTISGLFCIVNLAE
jgi:hypothetical protein